MKKDKRGLALITAIAVLALMLILFGGLATIYSAQVSRGKVELEQSQAMLIAQSYAEMLDQVLTSNNESADDLKEALGSIKAGKEVEIESRLANQPDNVIDSQVKITATADTATVSGNTTTRKIKVKVSATVDDETRSIDLDYTFVKIVGSNDLFKYALYGNQVKSYDADYGYKQDINGVDVIFDGEWYEDEGDNRIAREEYLEYLRENDSYRLGSSVSGRPESILLIERDNDYLPENETGEITNEDFIDYAVAENGQDEAIALSLWNANMRPDSSVPNCQDFLNYSDYKMKITQSCIWTKDLNGANRKYDVKIRADTEDIIIYLPVDSNTPVLSNTKIEFVGSENTNLFFYAYSDGSNAELKIAPSVEIKSNRDDKEPLDIYFVSNDNISLHIQTMEIKSNEPKTLEAYFYLPRGQMVLYETSIWKNTKRIEGCVVADRIALYQNNLKKPLQVWFNMEYVPPNKNIIKNHITMGEAGEKAISYRLNSYNEGGKS